MWTHKVTKLAYFVPNSRIVSGTLWYPIRSENNELSKTTDNLKFADKIKKVCTGISIRITMFKSI